jgi:hypothetical protein
MAKRNRTKGQTMQWPKETEQKDKQCNGQKKQNKRTTTMHQMQNAKKK